MDDFIFSGAKNTTVQSPTVEYYTVSGLQEFFDDNQMPRVNTDGDNVYAKKTIRDDGTIRYCVRLALNSKLCDPTAQTGENNSRSFLDNTVRGDNRFKNVSPKVFELYISFLKTKNNSWLLNAQREDE